MITNRTRGLVVALVLLASAGLAPQPATGQNAPTQRQLRTYIPPDELVSFLPSTPFSRFVETLSPIFLRVTGKEIVDSQSIEEPIGIQITGYHFFDAFELVLAQHGLTYKETDRFFVIQPAPEPDLVVDARGAQGTSPRASTGGETAVPASLGTREIQINAVLFELDHNRARTLGVDWNTLFGESSGQMQGGGGQSGEEKPKFYLRTNRLFNSSDNILAGPSQIDLSTVTQLFRALENQGAGKTIASPQITVQSGEEGQIQIGSDIPVQIRDFSGNTVTQFYQTGIIIDVTPTLIREAIADTAHAPEMEFIHLNVSVEKSSGRPSFAGLVIDRNKADTKVLLLDGEQTVIGGLYSTEESVTRRGIPILKDLPGWFFGLRYLFGVDQRTTTQKELLIVLQAELLEPLQARAQRPAVEGAGVEAQRDRFREVLRNFETEAARDASMRRPE